MVLEPERFTRTTPWLERGLSPMVTHGLETVAENMALGKWEVRRGEVPSILRNIRLPSRRDMGVPGTGRDLESKKARMCTRLFTASLFVTVKTCPRDALW